MAKIHKKRTKTTWEIIILWRCSRRIRFKAGIIWIHKKKRNVTASAERIVAGAGIQPLLSILCSLIEDRSTVSFPNKSFVRGMTLFNDYGYDVNTRNKDAKIIYVSPSHMTSYGDVMPLKRRIELTQYTEIHNSLIIEDDFDSDFIYQNKSIPSLYALTGCDNVIYLGSFSNVLIPGIRISFMVLTEKLKENSYRINTNIHRHQVKQNKLRCANTFATVILMHRQEK